MMPMNQATTDPEEAEATPDAESPAEDAGEAQGMKFCVVKLSETQYQVYKDLPEGGQTEGAEDMHETIDGKENMLKALVKLDKANPVGGDQETGFQAGYSAEGGGY